MVGYIYLIIDLTNWKKYVGQHHYHIEGQLDPNYHGSGHIIKMIYKKRPHTLKEVYLKTCYTQEELDEWEKYYIKLFNTLYPNGYNLTEGGNGGVPCEETRRKISNANKGKLIGKKNPFYGKHHSEENKIKWSEKKKGKHLSEELKRKLSKSNTNGKCSKKVLQFTLDGEFIREWPSVMECSRNGYDFRNISACCRGERKSAYGFKWCYVEE